jgi:hypothetical protein
VKWRFWILLAGLVLCLPLAFMAVTMPANEYTDQGLERAADCDGPLAVMLFAVPSYLIYGLGTVILIWVYIKTRRTAILAIVLLCCAVNGAVTVNVIKAYKQRVINATEYREQCGQGW